MKNLFRNISRNILRFVAKKNNYRVHIAELLDLYIVINYSIKQP